VMSGVSSGSTSMRVVLSGCGKFTKRRTVGSNVILAANVICNRTVC
jgi:hypothetical protein